MASPPLRLLAAAVDDLQQAGPAADVAAYLTAVEQARAATDAELLAGGTAKKKGKKERL